MRHVVAALIVLSTTAPAAAPASSASSIRCSTSTTHEAFNAYAHAVYRRDEVRRPALRRLDRLRACAPTKRASNRMLRRQRAEGRARARRLDPWGTAQAQLSPGMRGVLARLRGCETRGLPFPSNYRSATGNGFFGAYQWTPSSWRAAGGSGVASAASPAEQDVRTARWIVRYGTARDWPVCGR